ncbi:MAG: AMP-binding protein [Bacteroidales bacterium]|nr:AMP-binding protein [Bacteroidales bacterium]MBR4457660.1 AMP-binding protein [Clostridia bacterium]
MNYFIEHMLPEERELIPWLPTTAAFTDWICEKYADSVALSDPDRKLTYAELGQLVARKRRLLSDRCVPAASNVGLLGVNSIDEAAWFLAVTSSGRTAVMLPASLSPDVLARSAVHYELSALIADTSLSEKTQNVPVSVLLGMRDAAEKTEVSSDVSPKDRAAIFFTGGTTGTPKGVMLSHRALMRGTLNGTYRKGTVFGQRFVAVLPFIHVFGMIFSLLSCLYTGSEVGVCGQMREVFKEMQRVHPTTMIAVPGLAELMLTIARGKGMGALGASLKTIITGAAPVPPRLYHGFLPLGVQVLAGYGMTETANLVSGNLTMELHPDSMGKQYPEQEARIVDGELQVRGDMLFDGYWKDEAATRAAFTEDGWLCTGDLARIDEDGFIYIVGRKKNLIILANGENVSPEEIEQVFYKSPVVHDCLAREADIAGTPSIVLEVQPMPGYDEAAVRKALDEIRATLPSTMRPARFDLRSEDFEKSASMKIIRK